MVGEAAWFDDLAEKVKNRRLRVEQTAVEVRQLLIKTTEDCEARLTEVLERQTTKTMSICWRACVQALG